MFYPNYNKVFLTAQYHRARTVQKGEKCSMQLTEKQKETLKQNNIESNRITREAIQGALYLLMEKKDYDKITLTDIIKKSGVSRSALYRNYKTKEDIIHDIVNEFMEQFVIQHSNSLHKNWSFAFQFFLDNKKSLDIITKAKLDYILLDKINENLHFDANTSDMIQAMNNGLIFNVLMYWTKCGMPDCADDAAGHIVKAYKQIIKDVQMQY